MLLFGGNPHKICSRMFVSPQIIGSLKEGVDNLATVVMLSLSISLWHLADRVCDSGITITDDNGQIVWKLFGN